MNTPKDKLGLPECTRTGIHMRTLVVTVRFLRIFKKEVLVCADCYHTEPYDDEYIYGRGV